MKRKAALKALRWALHALFDDAGLVWYARIVKELPV